MASALRPRWLVYRSQFLFQTRHAHPRMRVGIRVSNWQPLDRRIEIERFYAGRAYEEPGTQVQPAVLRYRCGPIGLYASDGLAVTACFRAEVQLLR
jgi:hypothetical protein